MDIDEDINVSISLTLVANVGDCGVGVVAMEEAEQPPFWIGDGDRGDLAFVHAGEEAPEVFVGANGCWASPHGIGRERLVVSGERGLVEEAEHGLWTASILLNAVVTRTCSSSHAGLFGETKRTRATRARRFSIRPRRGRDSFHDGRRTAWGDGRQGFTASASGRP